MKVIKKLLKVGLIVMAVTPMINMSACSSINRNTANEVCAKLKDKYSCDFIATNIGDRLNTSHTKLFLHPQNDESLVFSATIDKDGQIFDDYVAHIISKKIDNFVEEAITSYGMACSSKTTIVDSEDIRENDCNISIEEFTSKYDISDFYVRIALLDDGASKEKLVMALEKASKQICVMTVVGGFTYSSDNYNECKSAMESSPSIGSTEFKSFSPMSEFSLVLKDGKSETKKENFSDFPEVSK